MQPVTPTTTTTTVRTAEAFRKPHPIRGILWGLIMGIGAAAIAIILKIIPFELVWALIVLGGGILLGILWSTLGPAKKPKGEPPWRPAEQVTTPSRLGCRTGATVTPTPARRRTPPHPAPRCRATRHRDVADHRDRPTADVARPSTGRSREAVCPTRWCRTQILTLDPTAPRWTRHRASDPPPPPRLRRHLRPLRADGMRTCVGADCGRAPLGLS